MCTVTIARWYGRLGNNIQQLATASHFAFVHARAHRLAWPAQPFLRSGAVANPSPDACPCDRPLSWRCTRLDEDNVFFHRTGSHRPQLSLYERKQCIQRYLLPVLDPALLVRTAGADLAVHLRGGDVAARRSGPYAALPESYFEALVAEAVERGEDVVVVHEDESARGLARLRERFSNASRVRFQSSAVAEDLATLASARSLACSVGTFGISAYELSRTIETLYLSHLRRPPLHLDDDPHTRLVLR